MHAVEVCSTAEPAEGSPEAAELLVSSVPATAMRSPLDTLVSEGILDDVLGRLKSGKEADVFRVVYRGDVVVAKVYKDRDQRSFQHNAAYKEGRSVRNSRTQRAIDKGSRFGRAEEEDEWKAAEARCLHRLHAAGVRVPTPVMFYEGVLLMELVTDADGHAAPRLIDAHFEPTQAAALYRDLRAQVVKMLCCDLIHGDLSPYNVLLGAAGPTVIDFPQTVSAAQNSRSESFFRRDLEGLQHFFARVDRGLLASAHDARDIWRAYVRRELSPDYVPVPVARDPRPPQNQYAPRGQQAPRPGGFRPRWQEAEGVGTAPRPPGAPPRGPQGPSGRSGPPRPRGPEVTYVKRTGTREPGPSVDRTNAAPPRANAPPPPRTNAAPPRTNAAPPQREPREALPDGNPHRRRKRHRG